MARDCNGSYAPSHRKRVKSGCRTCKLRRVKCDEGWPVCHRCQASGRVCDGYGVWGGGGNSYSQQRDRVEEQATSTESERSTPSSQIGLAKPLSLIPLAASERGCFEWFMYRSAIKLPGLFGSNYWTSLLIQASTNEPAIRHSVLALASAHQEEVHGASSCASESNGEQALFTVRQYNKAINWLKPSISDSRITSMRVTLITCALFANMEFLRGHYTKGLLHLEHGLGLLQEIGAIVESRDPSSTLVDGWLITIFTRLLVQAKLFGQNFKVPCQSFLEPSLPLNVGTFRSIHHARRSLEQILLRIFDLEEQSSYPMPASTAESGIDPLAYRDSIKAELHLWIKIHERTLSMLPPRHNPFEVFAYEILLLYYRLAIIWADTCLEDANEMTFDRHEAVFLGIISHCIEFYKLSHPNSERNRKAHHDPEPSSPNSVSDLGWIAPLYFTAIKCRNHRLRHQAVRLLQSIPHKEGIWNAFLAIIVAREVIEIEEGTLYDSAGEDEFDILATPTEEDLALPILPEECRLSKINIVLPNDRAGKLGLRYCQQRQSGVSDRISKEYDLPSKRWSNTTWAT